MAIFYIFSTLQPHYYCSGAFLKSFIMVKLFTYLGIINPGVSFKDQIVEISHKSVDRNVDMKAFTHWCNEFGVSRLVSKNNEFTVTIGNHEKLVKLERF